MFKSCVFTYSISLKQIFKRWKMSSEYTIVKLKHKYQAENEGWMYIYFKN